MTLIRRSREEAGRRTAIPKEYRFDYDTFYKDPEGYQFTDEDLAYWNVRELEEYEQTVPMTTGEKRALRNWVASGHSVHEHPDSRYICLYGVDPQPDFLDVYSLDRQLKQELTGKSREERSEYLKEFTGYDDKSGAARTETGKSTRDARGQTPSIIKEQIRKLKRETFYIWMFLSQEGLWEEAREFLKENMDHPVPFEEDI